MDTVKTTVSKHPYLSAWFVLALGMVAILVYEARNVGLEASQWFWLIVITVLVAGACIWIISWGDNDGDEETAEDEAAG
jgi:4-amino-4-deoxy-L-arabinose transferase-like glycosyltransferase